MSLELGEIVRAAFVPRGFRTLLPEDIDPVAKRIARKQRILDELPLIGGNSARMFGLTAQLLF